MDSALVAPKSTRPRRGDGEKKVWSREEEGRCGGEEGVGVKCRDKREGLA